MRRNNKEKSGHKVEVILAKKVQERQWKGNEEMGEEDGERKGRREVGGRC